MAWCTSILGVLALLSGAAHAFGVDRPLVDSTFAVSLTGFVVLVALAFLHKDCDQYEELP